MTTELTTEMRAHVIGPCDEAEKAESIAALIEMGESMGKSYDKDSEYKMVFRSKDQKWHPCPMWAWRIFAPTITFPAFKAKYLQP